MIVNIYGVNGNALERKAIIEDYYSLIWAERYFEVGDFELELPIEYAEHPNITFTHWLGIEGSDVVMLIEDIKPSTSEDKTSLLVRGRSSECVLDKRVLLDDEAFDDVAETIIYSLIGDNVTSGGNRRIYGFKTTFPSVSTTVEFADILERGSVYDAVVHICRNTGLGLKAVIDSNNEIAFQIYEGEDRSFGQAINPYVIFSDDFDNVIASSFFESKKDRINMVRVIPDGDVTYGAGVYVWTEGETEPKWIFRLEGILETTIDRDIDAPPLSDAEVLAIIQTRGRQVIKENKSVGLFEGDFDIQGNFKYDTDFFMGDIVQCNLEGKNVKARVVELVRSYSADGEKSYVALDFFIT